jgi:Xaa-Pro aminopeptidase
MDAERVDACVLAGPQNVTHLSGYHRIDGGPAALVIDREGGRTLVVMRDEVHAARLISDVDEILPYGERGFGINLEPLPALAAAVARLPAVQAARDLGIADSLGGLAEMVGSRCVATPHTVTEELARIRLVRDEDELVKCLHSYELSWVAQAAVARAARPGVSEIEIYDAAQSAAQLAHGEPIEFFADLLSGPATSEVGAPARIAGGRVVEDGDAVVADIVTRAGGYGGDTAETHVVGESGEVDAMRVALLRIREECAEELRPGVTGAEVFARMRGRVLAAFPDGEMPHHAGHGVAIAAFEAPHMIPGDLTPLENWMLIALEPGAYIPGRFGARVENCYVVTPSGGIELRDALGVG